MLNHGSYYVPQADHTVKRALSSSGLERKSRQLCVRKIT